MGEVGAILALKDSPGMTDADILRVIAPPKADRERSDLITDRKIPPHAEWRSSPRIGIIVIVVVFIQVLS